MKILHILSELKFSGAELLLASASEFLNKNGNTNIILSTGEEVGVFAPYLASRNFGIHHLPFRKSFKYLVDFQRFLRHSDVDVVHIHTERASFLIGIISLLSGKRVVRTVHNTFEFKGHLKLIRSAERQLLNTLGVTYVACSPMVKRNEWIRFHNKCRLVNNWFDPQRIVRTTAENRAAAREKLKIAPEDLVIISLGNYGPAKNQEAIVDGVRLLSGTLRIRYIHCGGGGEDLARQTNITSEDPITLAGSVNNINDYLNACDAFVSTSFFEGGQISLLEAAATGTFCITTNVGLAENFESQANVIFIEANATSLAQALRKLAVLGLDTRLENGQFLSDFAHANYRPEVGANAYLSYYEAGK